MKQVVCFGLLVLLTLAACTQYEREPLDLVQHEVLWKKRNAQSSELLEYIKKLQDLGEEKTKEYNLEDGISLEEAEIVALLFNPALRTARSKAEVARAYADKVGLWEDPTFSLDGARILSSIPEPWILATSLGFTLPLSGRLAVEKKLANTQTRALLQEAYGAEWQTRKELREKWLTWTNTKEQIAILGAFLIELEAILKKGEQLAHAGELKRNDVRLLELERILRKGQRELLEQQQEDQILELKAMLGLHPDVPITLTPSLHLPEVPKEALDREALQNHPNLQSLAAKYEAAENALEVEIRKQYPDITIGPSFEREEDQSRVGFGLSLPIPLWNRNQGGIAKALAERNLAKVEYETAYENLVWQYKRTSQKYERTLQYARYWENAMIPFIEEQRREGSQLLELGEFDAALLYDIGTRSVENRLKILEARLAERIAYNELIAFFIIPYPAKEKNE